MTEAEDETNRNTKLQKLKNSRNTRFCRSGRQNITPILFFFAKTEHKYQIAETEEKKKYQIAEADTKLQKPKRRRNTKTIAETEQKYQIAEADTKLQKLKRR